MIALPRLLQCARGATVVEFALIAPVLFLVMFGIIEGSRMVWTRQTLEEVAYATARCMSVDTACATQSDQQTYATTQAGGYGVTIVAADVAPQINVACNGFAGSSKVTITHTFDSVLDGMVPGFSGSLTAESCFPVLG